MVEDNITTVEANPTRAVVATIIAAVEVAATGKLTPTENFTTPQRGLHYVSVNERKDR